MKLAPRMPAGNIDTQSARAPAHPHPDSHPLWSRVAPLRPSLLAQVSVRRQTVRGERWYLLSNEAAGVRHRVNDSAYQFIGRCDGNYTVQELWNALQRRDADESSASAGDAAISQSEIIQL